MTAAAEQNEPTWGLVSLAPATARAAWGARAIATPGRPREMVRGTRRVLHAAVRPSFDLLWNRQGFTGSEASEIERLKTALNGSGGLARARVAYAAAVKRGDLRPDADGTVELVSAGGLKIVADTNASYGYVYLGAWFDAGALGGQAVPR